MSSRGVARNPGLAKNHAMIGSIRLLTSSPSQMPKNIQKQSRTPENVYKCLKTSKDARMRQKHPSRNYRKCTRRLRGTCALRRLWAPFLARSCLVRAGKTIFGGPGALRARFFARLGRFGARTCSSEPPQEAPGLDFWTRNNNFFEVLPFDENSMRKMSNIEKTS